MSAIRILGLSVMRILQMIGNIFMELYENWLLIPLLVVSWQNTFKYGVIFHLVQNVLYS